MKPDPGLTLGAFVEQGGVRFRCFATARDCGVQLVNDDGTVTLEQPLNALGDGFFEALVAEAKEGTLYFFVVDGRRLPDPYARFLPHGVHGPARVTTAKYTACHAAPQRQFSELSIYELHVGTFTPEGTFSAAIERLPEVATLGATAIQLMPVAAFPGERGWGYDGVALYATHAAYGTPDELRRLVDEAHALGLSVILDVVYNHFGPSGNYLPAYSSSYFSEDCHNAWGQAPNYADPVLRRLVLDNARYWLEEFGFDGLRLDATHAIVDASERHVLEDIVQVARSLEPTRWVIAEDERNYSDLVTRMGLTAIWADDFHHQIRVTLTGERHGYFRAFEPSVPGIADVINRGWLYSGQVNPVTGEPRGTSAHALPAEALVYCIQNHDQVGNRAMGDRFPPGGAYRAASLLLLFLPMTPLLFMGQEWAATSPFRYFTDHEHELGRLVSEGRRKEFADFPEFADPDAQQRIPDPQARETFLASKLRWSEREQPEQRRTLELYRAALELRHRDPVWRASTREGLHAEQLDGALVVQRVVGDARRVFVMNMGSRPIPLAPLADALHLQKLDIQIASSPVVHGTLSPRGAVVLKG